MIRNDCETITDRISKLLGQWVEHPHLYLRRYPNGTPFLLLLKTGQIHLCELAGNMDSDESWKALRRTDLKIIRLEKFKGSKCIAIENLQLFYP